MKYHMVLAESTSGIHLKSNFIFALYKITVKYNSPQNFAQCMLLVLWQLLYHLDAMPDWKEIYALGTSQFI